MSQADIWPTALLTKSFTGRKQGLSSPNSMPLHTCVNTRETWAKFFLDSTLTVEGTMSKVSGVLGETVHNNREYSHTRDLHDGGVDRPVVEKPPKARGVFLLGGMGELLPERSKSLTGKIPHGIWKFVSRVHDCCHEALAPPLQHLKVCITISPLASKKQKSRKDDRTADVFCASVRIIQGLVER